MRRARVAAASLAGLFICSAGVASRPARDGARGAARAPVVGHAMAAVSESEPNNSASAATLVALGDTIAGAIDPAGDVDYFALDLTAGTIVALDVDAWSTGSSLDPVVSLVGPDSVTVVAVNDDSVGCFTCLDSYLRYVVPTSGRYFVRLKDYLGRGGAAYGYVLRVNVVPPGPGDPARIVAASLGTMLGGLAVSSAGDLYVADAVGHRVVRVTPDGVTATFATTGALYPDDLAFDGYGNLLVTASEYLNVYGCVNGAILRFTPEGERSVFADLPRAYRPLPIAIGPDGSVYAGGGRGCTSEGEEFGSLLFRFDPSGMKQDSVFLKGAGSCPPGPASLAWSPAGELHYVDTLCGSGVYKLTPAGSALVIPSSWAAWGGFAFDRDGFLYAADPSGAIQLFDDHYRPVASPFAASLLGGVPAIQSGRDASGAMTARLFAVAGAGSVVELNPAAIRAPGFRPGVDLLPLATTALRDGTAGSDYVDTLRIANPTGAVTWSVTWGSLPPGLALGAASGVIRGVPEDSSRFRFTVRGTSGGKSAVGTLTITVAAPSVTVSEAAAHLVGGTPLAPEVQRYLDLRGNQNGAFDAGDLRALLRARARLVERAVVQPAGARR